MENTKNEAEAPVSEYKNYVLTEKGKKTLMKGVLSTVTGYKNQKRTVIKIPLYVHSGITHFKTISLPEAELGLALLNPKDFVYKAVFAEGINPETKRSWIRMDISVDEVSKIRIFLDFVEIRTLLKLDCVKEV